MRVKIIFCLAMTVTVIIAGGIFLNRGLVYMYRQSYPRDYAEYISLYSEQYNVEENLIYAVIHTESGFNGDAVSSVGARGLMQIMEVAFDDINRLMNDRRGTTYDDMYDHELNIEYGTFFLAHLLNEFGDTDTAIAAYHAGQSRVYGWLNEKGGSSDDKRLLRIPSDVTRHYVYKVNEAMRIYNKLY
ncbi:MAG: lytic transglycosylase domain-containing protein [Oscillospiraceae bacterium]|nr:lytic transglycosylase domain-containing protein [Oscillospiraceae bacterium]